MPGATTKVTRALADLGDRIYMPQYLNHELEGFPNIDSNWIEALKFFLSGYAFERQGRSPAYAPLAVEAIERTIEGRNPRQPDAELGGAVWAKFCRSWGTTVPIPISRAEKKLSEIPSLPTHMREQIQLTVRFIRRTAKML